MRHLTLVRSAGLLALVTLFSACSSDSTGPTYADTFTVEDAQDAAFSIAFGSDQLMQEMHWSTPDVGLFAPPALAATTLRRSRSPIHLSRLPALAGATPLKAYLSGLQASAPGCAISGHGSDDDAFTPYDGNENDVGDDFLVRVDCAGVDTVSPGVTSAWKEWGEVQIKEHAGVLWGWDASARQGYTDKQSDGLAHNDGIQENFYHLVVTADHAEYGVKGQSSEHGLDGEPYEDGTGGEFTLAFTATGDPIVFHDLFPPGTATLTGRLWYTDLEGPNFNWVIRTPDPLLWSPECAVGIDQPFVDGTVLALLNGNSQKGISLSAGVCGEDWEFAIFGDEVVPVAPKFQVRGFTLPKP